MPRDDDDDVGGGRSVNSPLPPPPLLHLPRLRFSFCFFLLVSFSTRLSWASPYENDAETPESLFTNEFVIQVPGGEAVARRVAEEHGLFFEGRVHENLGDYYVVRHVTEDKDAEEKRTEELRMEASRAIRRVMEEVEKRKRKKRSLEEEEEEEIPAGSTKRSAVDHLVLLKRDERLTYVARQRVLQRDKRGYLPRHLLIDEEEEEESRRRRKEARREEEEEGPAKMRNKWVEFERDAMEFERRHPAKYYRVEKKESENDEEKRQAAADEVKTCPKFNDKFWKDQWYLCNTGQTGGKRNFDLNLGPAWASGVTGRGVVVTVMDDGVDHDHKDLEKNFDYEASWDANGKRPKRKANDPEPRREDSAQNHGTKCAGEIAMEANNGVCGVGVAPDCKIGGIRILDGPITDRLEAQALCFKNEYIDVYSASWGPKDNGETMEGPGKMTRAGFKSAIAKGRGGKGNIFVWASGNGGSRGDDCGCDGYVGSIYTISIGSINENGLSTYFMEHCPSTMAVVFSGGMHDRNDWRWGRRSRIKTISTDIYQGCVENFQGTSAAAPLATGCVALALQANPNLTWRDVQHIVVHSARIPNPEETEGWEINGAGYHINDKFGFGVLDCSKMVQLAKNWTNVPPQKICETQEKEPNLKIPAGKTAETTLTTDACRDDPETRVDVIEHLRVGVKIKTARRGDVILRIRSPDGTSSELLSRRLKDKHENIQFIFMTVRNWGEDPAGTWTLEVVNKGDKEAVLEKVVLIIYGYQTQKELREPEVEAQRPSATQVDEIFQRELEASEKLQLTRVALVLRKFSEEDRRAVLSAMSPLKQRFVEEALKRSESEEKDELDEEAKREMGMKEEMRTLQELVDLIQKEEPEEESGGKRRKREVRRRKREEEIELEYLGH